MKRSIINITLLLLIGPLLTTAIAQQRSGKMMNKQMYNREYDTSTVETIKGEVVEVHYLIGKRKSNKKGVHLTLKTDSETIPVHLGPAWFIEQQESFEVGDEIFVTGSRITYNGEPALIAAEITRGKMTLKLRNQQGYPAWRGWRMNKKMNN
jgi:hypothetical protein